MHPPRLTKNTDLSHINLKDRIFPVIEQLSHIILGKEDSIRLALTCLIAKGHLLIEDIPGVGKTTLAHSLAKCLGLDFSRIQFTSDMLPADILGISVYKKTTEKFVFHPGPIFSQLVLADEINRASPKSQSALLEAMNEAQVTQDGHTRSLPQPFFVVATQNPVEQLGTFPLPESQLDRFMMCIRLGYPDVQAERALLLGQDRAVLINALHARMTPKDVLFYQETLKNVHVSAPLLDYIQKIITFTRTSGNFHHGLSPRAGLAILTAARAWASIGGRTFTIPEDVQAILPSVTNHRLKLVSNDRESNEDIGTTLISLVPIP